jgi:hypothetical protein
VDRFSVERSFVRELPQRKKEDLTEGRKDHKGFRIFLFLEIFAAFCSTEDG